MTNTTTVVDRGVEGDHRYVVADIDITSLGAAGSETFDPAAEFNIDASGGSVIQQENGGYHVTVDTSNNISVKYADYDAAADGVLIDVPSGTDVGVVRVRWLGESSP